MASKSSSLNNRKVSDARWQGILPEAYFNIRRKANGAAANAAGDAFLLVQFRRLLVEGFD